VATALSANDPTTAPERFDRLRPGADGQASQPRPLPRPSAP
jgi:hypothetical protein